MEAPNSGGFGVVQAAQDQSPVSGLTHEFYRYPARFSPVFVRAVIQEFSDVGDTVLAFTDGLIERRDEDIDAGQQRVLDALKTLDAPDLSRALDAVVQQLPDPDRDDDVAALAARRTA